MYKKIAFLQNRSGHFKNQSETIGFDRYIFCVDGIFDKRAALNKLKFFQPDEILMNLHSEEIAENENFPNSTKK